MTSKQEHLDKISNMPQLEMARLWRHALPGHPYFDCAKPYHAVFKKRFDALGGFTPEISKAVGWK